MRRSLVPKELKLPFAHKVLDKRPAPHEGHSAQAVVLVEIDDRAQTRFATYRANGEGACFWGHYTDDERAARHDFATR